MIPEEGITVVILSTVVYVAGFRAIMNDVRNSRPTWGQRIESAQDIRVEYKPPRLSDRKD